MSIAPRKILNLLEDKDTEIEDLGPHELAVLYTQSVLLVSVLEFLREQLWLKNKENKRLGKKTTYRAFIEPFFDREITSLSFLKNFIFESEESGLERLSRDSLRIEGRVISMIMEESPREQKEFLIESLSHMTKYFLKEDSDRDGPRLYRSFDQLDRVLKLDYLLDKDFQEVRSDKERLYEGGGVGVQSGFSTILIALHSVELSSGQKVIDLGSGYGRVGLVYALLRPDVDFIGYEYVSHRVKNANEASLSLGLEKNLRFEVQDLSLKFFVIPDADVYYLYDPFTKETYEHVLSQIVAISKRMKLTIISKGNSRSWISDIARNNSWPEPKLLDQGNLCIFTSR